MKKYEKPTLTRVELRADESLMAGSGFSAYQYGDATTDTDGVTPITIYRLANTDIIS